MRTVAIPVCSGLDAGTPADGVRLLGSGSRCGDTVPDSARPRAVFAAAGDVLARGRLDGFYERVRPAASGFGSGR